MKDGKMDRKMILAINLRRTLISNDPRTTLLTISHHMPLSNNYSLRAAKDQRPCFICGKFSSSVLDAPDDFFFVCSSHLKDSGFCSVSEISTATKTEFSEIEQLKKEISEMKRQGQSNELEIESNNKSEEPKTATVILEPAKAVYKLHRSILYLREQEKLKKEKLNLLKKLK